MLRNAGSPSGGGRRSPTAKLGGSMTGGWSAVVPSPPPGPPGPGPQRPAAWLFENKVLVTRSRQQTAYKDQFFNSLTPSVSCEHWQVRNDNRPQLRVPPLTAFRAGNRLVSLPRNGNISRPTARCKHFLRQNSYICESIISMLIRLIAGG